MTSQPLNPILKATLDYIKSYIAVHGYAPQQQDIAEHLGISRRSAVVRLRRLEARGYIKRYPKMKRGLEVVIQ